MTRRWRRRGGGPARVQPPRQRERLLKAAPHLIHGLEFVLPHEHAVRPWWMVRAGLYLYDLLGGISSLPRSRSLKPRDRTFTDPLKGGAKGFVYWDAFVDDARLTLAKADRWSLSIFGKNIFNEKYNRSVLPLLGVFQLTSRAETRHLGVEGRFNF